MRLTATVRHPTAESKMRRAQSIFPMVVGLLICASSASAHDCDAVLSQGVRNTYQELRTSDVRSAFALAYCSKTSSNSGRSSGTTASGSYAGYGLDYGTNASDTSESRSENCGGESLATSDTKYLNAMKLQARIYCSSQRCPAAGERHGPSSFSVERNNHNLWSWSSPVGMWAGCI